MIRPVAPSAGESPLASSKRPTAAPTAAQSITVTTLAATLSVAAFAAHADEPTKLPPVEVVSRYENDVGIWDSASQGAVTGDTIRKQPLLRPGEVLEAVPGMVVTQHSGDGKANQFFLRGYNLDHGTDFATWVAGMPVNMPTHAHGQGYTDLNFLIPELISRVVYTQGSVLRPGRRLRLGGIGADPVRRPPAVERGDLDLRIVRLCARAFRRLARGRTRQPRLRPRIPAVTTARGSGPTGSRKYNGVLRYAQGTPANGFNDHRDGLQGGLERDRPDPATRGRLRLDRPLRHARPDRRRRPVPLQPVRRVAAVGGEHQPGGEPVRDQVEAQPVLQLHVLPRQPGERRPVPAGRGARRSRRRGEPDVVHPLGRPSHVEHARACSCGATDCGRSPSTAPRRASDCRRRARTG